MAFSPDFTSSLLAQADVLDQRWLHSSTTTPSSAVSYTTMQAAPLPTSSRVTVKPELALQIANAIDKSSEPRILKLAQSPQLRKALSRLNVSASPTDEGSSAIDATEMESAVESLPTGVVARPGISRHSIVVDVSKRAEGATPYIPHRDLLMRLEKTIEQVIKQRSPSQTPDTSPQSRRLLMSEFVKETGDGSFLELATSGDTPPNVRHDNYEAVNELRNKLSNARADIAVTDVQLFSEERWLAIESSGNSFTEHIKTQSIMLSPAALPQSFDLDHVEPDEADLDSRATSQMYPVPNKLRSPTAAHQMNGTVVTSVRGMGIRQELFDISEQVRATRREVLMDEIIQHDLSRCVTHLPPPPGAAQQLLSNTGTVAPVSAGTSIDNLTSLSSSPTSLYLSLPTPAAHASSTTGEISSSSAPLLLLAESASQLSSPPRSAMDAAHGLLSPQHTSPGVSSIERKYQAWKESGGGSTDRPRTPARLAPSRPLIGPRTPQVSSLQSPVQHSVASRKEVVSPDSSWRPASRARASANHHSPQLSHVPTANLSTATHTSSMGAVGIRTSSGKSSSSGQASSVDSGESEGGISAADIVASLPASMREYNYAPPTLAESHPEDMSIPLNSTIEEDNGVIFGLPRNRTREGASTLQPPSTAADRALQLVSVTQQHTALLSPQPAAKHAFVRHLEGGSGINASADITSPSRLDGRLLSRAGVFDFALPVPLSAVAPLAAPPPQLVHLSPRATERVDASLSGRAWGGNRPVSPSPQHPGTERALSGSHDESFSVAAALSPQPASRLQEPVHPRTRSKPRPRGAATSPTSTLVGSPNMVTHRSATVAPGYVSRIPALRTGSTSTTTAPSARNASYTLDGSVSAGMRSALSDILSPMLQSPAPSNSLTLASSSLLSSPVSRVDGVHASVAASPSVTSLEGYISLRDRAGMPISRR